MRYVRTVPPDPEFQAVLGAAASGDERALTALYRSLHPRLLRYLRAIEPGDAEDIASEVWVGIIRGLGRFRGDRSDLFAWAFSIARRRALDLRRTRARRATDPRPDDDLVALSGWGDVEREAMDAVSTREAIAMVASLPAAQAEVVLLRVLGDLTVQEVARIMARRPGTIRVLQHRALRRLAAIASRERVTR